MDQVEQVERPKLSLREGTLYEGGVRTWVPGKCIRGQLSLPPTCVSALVAPMSLVFLLLFEEKGSPYPTPLSPLQ
jgi:hypothetical protein